MNLTTRIGLALLLVSALSLVVGAGGFSATEADRDVAVTIVEDGDAYVGLGPTDDDGQYDGDINTSFTDADARSVESDADEIEYREEDAAIVTNQFTVDIDLQIDVEKADDDGEYPELRYEYNEDSSSSETDDSGQTATVPTGEHANFDAVVTCPVTENDGEQVEIGDAAGTFAVTFSVDGVGISADVTRDVEVNCDGQTIEIVDLESDGDESDEDEDETEGEDED